MEVIFWDFDRRDIKSVGVARYMHRLSTTSCTYANADSDRSKSCYNRLIKDKIRIKILKLLATADKKSNILEKIDDFLELLRAIIYTGD
ncbi:hypothetical protein H6G97_18110 [Nostoc flagelliforme FACHB-838]|uniref:ArsR family transcriptional regulator n=1 Tax=Nostoc flagelliforme FACHB-838 TaxID=2692904 RepID=A0ABR8DR62_9NOSO|nr:hypothetical protein [Nostoc flagelliforme]MBD2531395.1 hypothetical protein [Nostoc flagelliforme FACHB-838]